MNSGIARAAKVLHRLLHLPVGNTVGDATVAAVGQADPAQLVARLCDERLAFLKSLKTWPVFGAGWGRRVAEVRRDALAMAKGAVAAPAATQAGGGKARVPAPRKAQAATASAAVIVGAAAASAAQNAGASWFAILVIAGLGVLLAAAGWIGWSLWQRRRQEAPVAAAEEGA